MIDKIIRVKAMGAKSCMKLKGRIVPPTGTLPISTW